MCRVRVEWGNSVEASEWSSHDSYQTGPVLLTKDTVVNLTRENVLEPNKRKVESTKWLTNLETWSSWEDKIISV